MTRFTRALGVSIAAVLGVGAWCLGSGEVDRSAPSRSFVTDRPSTQWTVVSDVVALRGDRLRDGRLLAVRSRRVLDAHAFPARIRLGGRFVQPSDLVPRDAQVEVVPGRDRVEPVERRTLPGRPLLIRVGGRQVAKARVVELTVGAVSGEEIGRRVLLAAPVVKPRWHGTVLLTFDDGPDPTWTPRVLALLKQRHVHAVFCLVGREVRKHPALVRRILQEGHALCSHTENHDEHLAAEPLAVARMEILRGADAMRRATGIRPVWFRAPGGGWSPGVEQLLGTVGMVPLKWTVDPRDWERPPARLIVGRVLLAARPGSIVLLHDGGGDRRESWAALRSLLVALPRLGLTFAEPQEPAQPPRPSREQSTSASSPSP